MRQLSHTHLVQRHLLMAPVPFLIFITQYILYHMIYWYKAIEITAESRLPGHTDPQVELFSMIIVWKHSLVSTVHTENCYWKSLLDYARTNHSKWTMNVILILSASLSTFLITICSAIKVDIYWTKANKM